MANKRLVEAINMSQFGWSRSLGSKSDDRHVLIGEFRNIPGERPSH